MATEGEASEREAEQAFAAARALGAFRIAFGLIVAGSALRTLLLGRVATHYLEPSYHFSYGGLEVLGAAPDVLVLHESPRSPSPEHRGRGKASLTRAILEHAHAEAPPLVISGHVGWPEPLDEVEGGPQFLNVEERVVLLTRERLGGG